MQEENADKTLTDNELLTMLVKRRLKVDFPIKEESNGDDPSTTISLKKSTLSLLRALREFWEFKNDDTTLRKMINIIMKTPLEGKQDGTGS